VLESIEGTFESGFATGRVRFVANDLGGLVRGSFMDSRPVDFLWVQASGFEVLHGTQLEAYNWGSVRNVRILACFQFGGVMENT
jgi:hypothetical protein